MASFQEIERERLRQRGEASRASANQQSAPPPTTYPAEAVRDAQRQLDVAEDALAEAMERRRKREALQEQSDRELMGKYRFRGGAA